MKLNKLKEKVVNNIINVPGWRTNRKIVVFESDDWGSSRMRSIKDYNYFLKKGYKVDQCAYNKYDSLESNDDLTALFDVLLRFKDKHNISAIFTLNNICANPDFKKIREVGFKKYFYESFTETLKKYSNHHNVVSLYHEGIANCLIKPQFHGREHLNVKRWLDALRKGEEHVVQAFDREMFTVYKSGSISGRNNYLDTYGLQDPRSINFSKESIEDGLELFEKQWGYKSKSFIAPTYVWPVELEETLNNSGVKYIQGTHVQRVPNLKYEKGINKKYHYLGQKNKFGQRYLVRNAFFEPSSDNNFDWIGSCLKDIERAFRWRKPAVIGSHRVNYIGGIFENNRTKNLDLLNILLDRIVSRYPDIEFMTSDELGDLINSKN